MGDRSRTVGSMSMGKRGSEGYCDQCSDGRSTSSTEATGIRTKDLSKRWKQPHTAVPKAIQCAIYHRDSNDGRGSWHLSKNEELRFKAAESVGTAKIAPVESRRAPFTWTCFRRCLPCSWADASRPRCPTLPSKRPKYPPRTWMQGWCDW